MGVYKRESKTREARCAETRVARDRWGTRGQGQPYLYAAGDRFVDALFAHSTQIKVSVKQSHVG